MSASRPRRRTPSERSAATTPSRRCGRRGFYYLVFTEPPLRPSSYADLVSDPVCPQCSTVYNRAEVVRLIREQVPELFDSPLWSTRFRCTNCGAEVPVSGAGDAKQD